MINIVKSDFYSYYANIALGQKIDNWRQDKSFFKRHVLTRLVSAVALPIFHTFEFLIELKNTVINRSWSDFKDALKHLTHIPLSIAKTIYNPDKTIKKRLFLNGNYISFPTPPHSRLGDHLKNYMTALYLSKKKNLPLLFRSFEFSDQLQCQRLHTNIANLRDNTWKRFVKVVETSDIPEQRTNNGGYVTIYQAPFMFKINTEEDPKFKAQYLENIKPVQSISEIPVPDGHTPIALHIRKGGTFDHSNTKYEFPLKLADDSFYKGELLKLLNQPEFANRKPYIHIFTDSTTPQNLKDEYQKFLKENKIEGQVGYNPNSNESSGVIEDMYRLSRFQYIIRPDSGFSEIATMFGSPTQTIFPIGYTVTGNRVAINNVARVFDNGKSIEEKTDYAIINPGLDNKNIPDWWKKMHKNCYIDPHS